MYFFWKSLKFGGGGEAQKKVKKFKNSNFKKFQILDIKSFKFTI